MYWIIDTITGFKLILMTNDKSFIEKVTVLFVQNGAKSLTMDDIAREFGISKKTLYRTYRNKEALLEEVLTNVLEGVLERVENLNEKIDNAVERMFCRDVEIEKASTINNSIMLRQLIKYYPDIFNKHMKNFSENFSNILIHNIERGRTQGYYREDFDAKFYGKLYFQLVMSYDSPYLDTSDITRYQYHSEALKFFMQSITTPKGKEFMKELGFG